MNSSLKLKHITNFVSGVGFPEDLQGQPNGDIPFMKVSDINGTKRDVDSAVNYVSHQVVGEKGWKPVGPGAILMAKIGAALTKNHRKILMRPALIDNNMLAAIPKHIDTEYYYWLWQTIDLTDHQNVSSVPSVNMESLKTLPVAVPERDRQKVVSAYLGGKTSTIDKMIAAKNHTHTQLSELRTAIISELIFSAGNDTMNIKLRRIATLMTTKRFTRSDSLVITLENVQSWTGRLLGHTKPENVTGELVEYKKGDVLFNKLRPYLAKAHIAEDDGMCTGEMLVLRPNTSRVSAEYLFYFLTSKKIIDEINVSTYGVKMPRANWDFIGSLEINLPSLNEQKKIVKELEVRLQKIDQADNTLQKSISQLEEYRTSLISNVITGKVEI